MNFKWNYNQCPLAFLKLCCYCVKCLNNLFQSSFLRSVSPGDNVHSITLATSGLGNSINSSWEHDNVIDTMLHYRNQSDAGTNGYLGNSFTGASLGDSIDLFREKDTGSESSFGGDDFDT